MLLTKNSSPVARTICGSVSGDSRKASNSLLSGKAWRASTIAAGTEARAVPSVAQSPSTTLFHNGLMNSGSVTAFVIQRRDRPGGGKMGNSALLNAAITTTTSGAKMKTVMMIT